MLKLKNFFCREESIHKLILLEYYAKLAQEWASFSYIKIKELWYHYKMIEY